MHHRTAHILTALILFLCSISANAQCTAPSIPTLPPSTTKNSPGTWTLNPNVSGASTYQWYKDGVAIAGQTRSRLDIYVEQGTSLGIYTLKATSACGATTTSSDARLFRVLCSASPGMFSENIYRKLAGQPDYCYWQEELNPNFPNIGTDTGGSYNKAVISAAVQYLIGVKDPFGVYVYHDWWRDYLKNELGKRAQGVWFYGGQETGSFQYQHFNIISVYAVAYQAHLIGDTEVRSLALEWLRNTFTLHALAAAPTPMKTRHSQGLYRTATTYNGPYIPMAGERSDYNDWNNNDRNILFAQAVGFSHNGQGESSSINHIRRFIETAWTSTNPNSYGLSDAQRTALKSIVQTGNVPSGLIGSYLSTTLRTKMRYHIVAWQSPEVVRLTLMEANKHKQTAPTFGAVFFTAPRLANGGEVHFLWPWSGVFANDDYKSGITDGTGTIDLTAGRISASQPGMYGSPHPAMTVTVSGLPSAASKKYWIILRPDGDPIKQ